MAVVEMNVESYKIRVPGKLMIAGEYAILEPGHEAILIAVDRYISLEIFQDISFNMTIEKYKIKKIMWQFQEGQVKWQGLNSEALEGQLQYLKKAIEMAYEYCLESHIVTKTYGLIIHSNLEEETTGIKYGLGSSAAVVVAVISGILALHHQGLGEIDRELIYKLAYLAHLKTQGNGSGADIATSVYGGLLIYRGTDYHWLKGQMAVLSLTNLLKAPWPQLKLQKITPPKSVKILVGWTGSAMSTAKMVRKYHLMAEDNPQKDKMILMTSNELIRHLIHGFETDDELGIFEGIKACRQWLEQLDITGNIGIMTPKLKALCDLADQWGAGKPSGAGGGDCGIAFLKATETTDLIVNSWVEHGIVPLNLGISLIGVECMTVNSSKD